MDGDLQFIGESISLECIGGIDIRDDICSEFELGENQRE